MQTKRSALIKPNRDYATADSLI